MSGVDEEAEEVKEERDQMMMRMTMMRMTMMRMTTMMMMMMMIMVASYLFARRRPWGG